MVLGDWWVICQLDQNYLRGVIVPSEWWVSHYCVYIYNLVWRDSGVSLKGRISPNNHVGLRHVHMSLSNLTQKVIFSLLLVIFCSLYGTQFFTTKCCCFDKEFTEYLFPSQPLWGHERMTILAVTKLRREQQALKQQQQHPTKHLTFYSPKNPSIHVSSLLRSTDLEALIFWKVW